MNLQKPLQVDRFWRRYWSVWLYFISRLLSPCLDTWLAAWLFRGWRPYTRAHRNRIRREDL